MKAEALLSRLDKVKPTGSGRWVACCPAHNDRSPSLSIRELDDGRVLVHCFSGCEVEAVLGAVGLTFDALYPEKLTGNGKPRERRPFPATDILRALLHETLVVALAGYKIARGELLAPVDQERLTVAVERIRATAGMVDHG